MPGMREKDTNLKQTRKASSFSDLSQAEQARIDPQLIQHLNWRDASSLVSIIVKLTSFDDAVLDTLPSGFSIRRRMKLLAMVSGEGSVETILQLAQCRGVVMISEDLEVQALEGTAQNST